MTSVNRNLLLLVAATVLFTIAALIGFDVIHTTHILGWGFAGAAAFAASRIP